jgi:UDP-3-O-[3-hydroxymyristoyl] glucosamine N-acyltransferase
MASQSGLGGTTVVEDDCEFAGGAQIAGHLTIGKGAVIAAKAGVTKSIPAGAVYAGFPSEPIDKWRKGVVAIRRLAEGKR